VFYPQDITINATPIYMYTYGMISANLTTIYIIRGDNVSASGKVPPEVVDLSFSRVSGNDTDTPAIPSLKPCSAATIPYCINQTTGQFMTPVTDTLAMGTIGEVVNIYIKVTATDRAGNSFYVMKVLYSDLENPIITVCTSSGECVGNISGQKKIVTEAHEMESICQQKCQQKKPCDDLTCYDRLITWACENSGIPSSCYVDYVSKKLLNPDLAYLCSSRHAGLYSYNCFYSLATNLCLPALCDNSGSLKQSCEEDTNPKYCIPLI